MYTTDERKKIDITRQECLESEEPTHLKIQRRCIINDRPTVETLHFIYEFAPIGIPYTNIKEIASPRGPREIIISCDSDIPGVYLAFFSSDYQQLTEKQDMDKWRQRRERQGSRD